jgi:N-acetylneuraminic acid mutarotase
MRKCIALLLVLAFLFASFVFLDSPVSATSDDSWATKAPMSQARFGLGVGVVNGKIYAIGGRVNLSADPLGVNEEYDPATDTWTNKSSMPTPRADFGAAVYNNKIYAIGGRLLKVFTWDQSVVTSSKWVYSGACEAYDPATDSWERLTDMPSKRDGVLAAVVGDKIYLVDGGSGITEVYDPAADSWSTKPAPPVVPYRDNGWRGTCVVVDDKIHLIGGFPTNNSHQVYEPSTDTWTIETPLLASYWFVESGATSGMNAPKRIYALGSSSKTTWIGLFDDWPVSVCQNYDFKTGNWTNIASMPSGRFQVSVAVLNDRIYTIGGWLPRINNQRIASTANEVYTPTGYGNVHGVYADVAVAIVLAVAFFAGLAIYVKRRHR